jgi:hypothetical protein
LNESYAKQRDRILADSDTDAATFDLFVALGYEPESWHGMWKLTSNPVVFRGLGFVIYREVVYKPGTTDTYWRDGKVKTRLRIKRDPIA